MPTREGRAARNAAVYVLVDIVQKSLGFLLLPLYTSYLSPSDYGVISVVNSLGVFISVLFGLSLNGVVTRFYYKYKDDQEKVRVVWGTVATLTLVSAGVLSILLAVFNRYFLMPFAPGIPFYPYVAISLATCAFAPLFGLYVQSLQARQEGPRLTRLTFSFFVLNVGLTILFVVKLRWGAMGVLAANLGATLVFFAFSAIRFIPAIAMGIDRSMTGEALRYSLPLLPHQLAGKIGATFDRLFLNGSHSQADVGLYNIGSQIASVFPTIAASINRAFTPWFFEQAESGQEPGRRIGPVATSIMAVYVLGGLVLSLFAPEIISIMASKSFQGAWITVPFLAFSGVMTGYYYVCSNTLFLDRTKLVPLVTLSSAAVNVVLNVLLIPRYSMVGAAVSSLLAQAVQASLAALLSWRFGSVHYRTWPMFLLAILGFACASAVWIIPPGFLGLAIKAGLAGAWTLLLWITKGKSLVSLVRSRKGPAAGGAPGGSA